MDEDWSHMTEGILDLTLEIIHLLTGEDYEVVKKTPAHLTNSRRRKSPPTKSRRSPASIMWPLVTTRVPVRSNQQQILEITNKIIELLTGEVPVRCEDVAVYLSVEEREYLEGHKELYEAAMMEEEPPLALSDTSMKDDPLERSAPTSHCHESTQEELQPHDELEDPPGTNDEDDEEGQEYEKALIQRYYQFKEEHSSIRIATDTSMKDDPLERSAPTSHCHESTQEELQPHDELEDPPGTNDEDDEEGQEYEKALIQGYYQFKEEHSPIRIATDVDNRTVLGEHQQTDPTDYRKVKSENISQDYPENDAASTLLGLGRADRSQDDSASEEPASDGLNELIQRLGQRGSKLFLCSTCGKGFTTYGGLLMHQRHHTGEKPFSCSVCGKSFTQKGILVNHEKIHRGIRPFPCSLCGKSFAKKSDVARHLTVHTGEKPYPCDRCGKCFSQRSSLLNHLRLSICEKPYPCFLCGKRFVQRSELARHQDFHRKKGVAGWSG